MIPKFAQWSLVAAVVAGGGVLAFAARTPARPATSTGAGFDPFTKSSVAVSESSNVVSTGVSRRLVNPPFRPPVRSRYRRPPGAPPFNPPGPPPVVPPPFNPAPQP